VLAEGTRGVFTIPHFDGFAAVLLHLPTIPKRKARELLTDGWLACAPRVSTDELVRMRRSHRR
jgi:hypothetical protein